MRVTLLALQIPWLVGSVPSLIGWGFQQAERNAHCLQANSFRSGRGRLPKWSSWLYTQKKEQGISGIKVTRQLQMIQTSPCWCCIIMTSNIRQHEREYQMFPDAYGSQLTVISVTDRAASTPTRRWLVNQKRRLKLVMTCHRYNWMQKLNLSHTHHVALKITTDKFIAAGSETINFTFREPPYRSISNVMWAVCKRILW